jgi:hypothetical protein
LKSIPDRESLRQWNQRDDSHHAGYFGGRLRRVLLDTTRIVQSLNRVKQTERVVSQRRNYLERLFIDPLGWFAAID